jgi:5-methyltetrahydrofolate--homocysteine methyltransferase
MMDRQERLQALLAAMRERILVLDGAWGSLIQRYGLEDADFRGTRFATWPAELKGDPDLLNITRPDIVREIHDRYIEAGADITSTNTFSSNRIAQADYRLEDVAQEMNEAGARIARQACDDAQDRDGRVRWVAGSIGPTNRTASISPDVNDPGARNVDFEELRAAYAEAVRGLMDGGADILLIETITDTLNAKAAVFAADDVFEERGESLPIILSGTIVDRSGRTLSGQTLEAFWTSLAHARPLAVGLNCALGPEQLREHIAELARIADVAVAAYPNAGLPNEFGGYDETPEQMSGAIGSWAREGIVNIVGSCCGSTPEHTRAIAEAVRGVAPHAIPEHRASMHLAGLESVEIGG